MAVAVSAVPHINPVGVIETTGGTDRERGHGLVRGSVSLARPARGQRNPLPSSARRLRRRVIIQLHGARFLGTGASGGLLLRDPSVPSSGHGGGVCWVALAEPGSGSRLWSLCGDRRGSAGWRSWWVDVRRAVSLLRRRADDPTFPRGTPSRPGVDGGYVQTSSRTWLASCTGDRTRSRRVTCGSGFVDCVCPSPVPSRCSKAVGAAGALCQEVVNGILGWTSVRGPSERGGRPRPEGPDGRRRRMVTIAVGDLCSNAVNAGASRFRWDCGPRPPRYGSWLTLEAECVCGKSMPEVPEDSSLMRLATLLHYNRGTFVISDGGGSHRFTLRWPSTSRPRTRTCPERT